MFAFYAKTRFFFFFLWFFYLRPKFGQLLPYRPKHFMTAKGFTKRPESRNLAVKTAKWQPWNVHQIFCLFVIAVVRAAVKCPFCLDGVDFESYATKPNLCLEKVDGEMYLKRKHQYYYQVQQQLFATNKAFCDFVVCGFTDTAADFFHERFMPDELHWNHVLPKLS